VSSKCFRLYYTCSDCWPLHLPSFSPLTVTIPKLAVILRPLYVSPSIHCQIGFTQLEKADVDKYQQRHDGKAKEQVKQIANSCNLKII
jgi:hypothetical protein